LKKSTRVFHQQLLLLLETQLDQARSGDWDEVLKPMSTYIGDSHEVLQEVLANELDNDTVNAVDSSEPIIIDEPQEDMGLTIDIPELIKSDEE
jgi:cell division initiation protein